MKQFLLLVCCCCFSALALAQTTPPTITVKGIVIDSAANKPLSYVTVALQDAKTKLPVKSNLTKDDGSFELKAIAGKPYKLVLEFTGYKAKVLAINGTKSITDAGLILLQPSSKKLNDIVIRSVKPLMKQEVDRISYDVQADPESKSLTALDMMRKVPLLSVDASDNIKLKGSGNYKILINGKESALLAKNPSDVLRSMPGTNIVKIEVITTPPAKYDAEGLAGIINIITTKNIDQGYNLGITTRYNTVWGTGLNLNSNVKQGKFGFSGYAGLGKQNRASNTYDNLQTFITEPSVLHQNGTGYFSGNYKYADGEFSYGIDTLNLLTASIDFNSGNNSQDNSGYSRTFDSNKLTQQFFLDNSNLSNYTGIDVGFNYQLGFKRSKDQLLTLSYRYSYSPNHQNSDNNFTNTVSYPQSDFKQYNKAGNKENTFQLDYVQPFNKELSIEAGAKAIIRDNFSDFNSDTLNAQTHQYNLNPAQTNDFTYGQNVYSLYNSYRLKLDKWTAKGGLRLEETTINADFSSSGTSLNTSYGNLIPSLSIQRSLKNSSINFGFTERIQRPNIYQLNPFIDRSNPKFVNTGNSNLKPELNHVFDLNYSYFTKGSVNAGLSYSFSNNSIQNVTSLHTDTIGGQPEKVTYSTYQNVGSNKGLSLNLNANYPLTTRLSLNVNGLISHIWLKGYYNDSLYRNNGYTGNMYANISYKFDNGFRVGVNAGYYSGNVNLQGKSNYYLYTSYVVSKEFFNKNASISFVANNPYSKYWAGKSYTNTQDFQQVTNYQQIYRTFSIRLSYKFGKLNSDIKKNERGINNDDIKSSSKGSSNQ